jgi:isopentenyldiphosphate isomerase
MDDEYLDLVDEDDRVIGKKLRSEVQAEGLSNFRVVNAFLINSKGELWIPRRTASKRIFPSCLDMSVGGHVSSGETYEQSFGREAAEELNIDTTKADVRFLGHVTPRDGFSANENVYEIRQDETPAYNPEDFTEYFWLTPTALLQRLTDGDTAKGDLAKLVQWFYIEELKNHR